MRILAVNWLDLENPKSGGAEVHFFEIFGRLASRGHHVTLVTSGWASAQPSASILGIEVQRHGGRHTFALHGRGGEDGTPDTICSANGFIAWIATRSARWAVSSIPVEV